MFYPKEVDFPLTMGITDYEEYILFKIYQTGRSNYSFFRFEKNKNGDCVLSDYYLPDYDKTRKKDIELFSNYFKQPMFSFLPEIDFNHLPTYDELYHRQKL